MSHPAAVDDLDRFRTKIPKPLPGGSYSIESMGRWIDRLLGDRRDRREAANALASLVIADDEDEPEPVEIPTPIPGGTEPATKGADPRQEHR